jgi:hypothetical protein
MSKTIGSELTADQEVKKREMARKLEPFLRSALLAGVPAETLTRALGGQPDPQAEESLQTLRDRTQREARVEARLEVAITLKRLEILWAAMMSKRDLDGALRVVQERARFTRAADYVMYAGAGDVKRPKSPFELDLEEIGPAARHKLTVEYQKKTMALAEETRARNAQEKVTPALTKVPGA